ncbi:MAG: efflux RND transporter periplasmic adaptor subunit [Pseudomonadota bacterium]
MFRKFFTIVGTLGIILLGVAGVMTMNALKPTIERQTPDIVAPTVFFTVAEPRPVTLDVYAQGEVRPRTDISLTAQVAGQVVSMSENFVNGGAFSEGDTLIKIEDAEYRATAAAARARLAQEEAEAALARSEYEDLNRVENPTDLALRVPQLAQARAEYRAAQLNLERTTIKAPFDGRVRERIVGVGQYIAPGAQLGRIFSTDVAEIRLPLTDNDLAKLGLPVAFVETSERSGPSATLTAFVAGELREWNARIARTDGAIDPATRQIAAIAVVDHPYDDGASEDGTPLAMGLFVDAAIEGRRINNAIVLPRAALHGRDEVYVVGQNNILQLRKVNVAASDRDTITVVAGIAAGERVVTSPLRGATDGDRVETAGTPVDDLNDPDADLSASAASAIVAGDTP